MTLKEKKEYITKFVCQGLTIKKAYKLTYCTPEEIEEIKGDKELMNELGIVKLNLSLHRIDSYNLKVDNSPLPNDELKRLSTIMEVIEEKEMDMPGDMKLTIIKQRGED